MTEMAAYSDCPSTGLYSKNRLVPFPGSCCSPRKNSALPRGPVLKYGRLRFAVILGLLLTAFAVPPASGRDKKDAPISIGIVTARDLQNSSCGSLVLDPDKIPPAPALNLDKSQIRVRGLKESDPLINNLMIRTSDGVVQPASQPFCLENTEVLRQPLEVLYGGDVAGKINLAPRLTRIIHEPFTAAAYMGISTVFRSLGLLDVLSSTPPGPSVASLVSMPI